jgi:hypothetical protein
VRAAAPDRAGYAQPEAPPAPAARDIAQRLAELEVALAAIGTGVTELVRRLDAETQGVHSHIEAFRPDVNALFEQQQALGGALAGLAARLTVLELRQAVEPVTRLLRRASLRTQPLVSVVLPTADRTALLRRAIESVVAQSYPHWQLLIVDDGVSHDAGMVVESFADGRIHSMTSPAKGPCAARNLALSEARGELITYLDDDNIMDADWLRAVVWAFENRPDVEVLYGATIIDDVLRVNRQSSGALPTLVLQPWDRRELGSHNLADIGALAHRQGLPEAVFDESLREMGDWDFLLSLTATREPLVLPALSCFYTTDAPGRLSGGPTFDADRAAVMARAAALAER